jgi:protease secretion system outer membrane protein
MLENENDVINAKLKLQSIIGAEIDNVDSVAKLASNFRYFNTNLQDFSVWKDKAIANNIELQAMKDQIEIANQEYKKNISGHYPVLNLIAAATQQTSYTTSTINQFASQSYLGVQLNLPIYGGGEIQARANQSYALFEKAQADYRVAYDRVLTELRKQYDIVITAKKKIDALTGALDSSKELVKAMRLSVRSGEKINLDVLTADKTLYVSRRDLAQAKYAYLIAYLKLNQMTGSSEMDDFEKIQTYFK